MKKETLTLDQFESLIPQENQGALSVDEFESLLPREEVKAKSRGFLDHVKYFFGEGIMKPVARGVEVVPAQFEIVKQMNISRKQDMYRKMLVDEGVVFGATTPEEVAARSPEKKQRIAEINKIVDDYDKILETSKRMQRHWIELTKTGIEAPSERFLSTSPIPFDKDFSFTRLFALATESFPMLAMGAALSKVSGSAATGAMFVSMFDAAEEYNIAREKGLADQELNLIFAADLLVLSALETVPLTTFMKGGRVPLQMFKIGLQEGGEEVLQKLWKDSVAILGYDETRSLTEGLIEAFLAGFISGGMLGTFSPSPKVKKQLDTLKEKGVDTEKMIDTVGRQVIDNAEEITDQFMEKVGPEAVETGKPVEITPEEAVKDAKKVGEGIEIPSEEEGVKGRKEEQVRVRDTEESGVETEKGALVEEPSPELPVEEEWTEIESIFEKKVSDKKLTLNEEQALAEIELEYEKERVTAIDEIKKSITGQIKKEGGEEFELIPLKLFSKTEGVGLDSLATELESQLVMAGYDPGTDGLRSFIYNEIGQQGEKGKIHKIKQPKRTAKSNLKEINLRVAERDAGVGRIIRIVEKRLGKAVTTSGAKIRKKIKPPSPKIILPEEEALKIKLRAMQKASKQGEKAGVKKEHVRLTEIIDNKKTRKKEFDMVKKMLDFIDKVPTSGLPVEYVDVINEIKTSIGFYREGKKKATSARNILSRGKAVALDPDIMSEVSELEKINTAEMTTNELVEVYDIIQQLYHSGIHQNKFMIANNKANFLETVIAGTKNIVNFGKNINKIATLESPPKGHSKWNKELLQKYFAEHRRPEAMVEEFDGFKEDVNYTTLFVPLNEASQKKEQGLDKAKERLSKILSEIDIFNIIHKRVKIAGVERKVYRDEMLFIYANTLHPQNQAHLKASGVTEEAINDVNAKLTPEEKNIVNEIVIYFNELYDSIDAIYVQLKGKHLPRIEGVYFPIQNLANVGDIEQIELQIKGYNEFMRTGVASDFTKTRATKSDKAYGQFSFMNTVFRHINQVEHYKAFALPVRDASKYLKHPSIKNALIQNYGQPTYDVLNDWLDNIARGRDKYQGSWWDDAVLAIRTNFVVSVLGGNLSTVIKQPVSFSQGMGYIGKRAALNGLAEFMVDPVKAIAFVKSKSIQMEHRHFAQERELQDIVRGRSLEIVFKQYPKLADYFKDPKRLVLLQQFIKEGSMRPILWADQVTVTAIWLGEYRKQCNLPGVTDQAAIALADKAIRRTQPQSGLVHLPAVFQSDPVRKMFTIFKNQPNQNFNLNYDAVVKYGKNKKNFKATAELVNKLMMYWILSSFLFGLASRKRMPEDKKEVALDLVQATVGGLVGLSNIYNKVVYPWGSDNLLAALWDNSAKVISAKDMDKKLECGVDLIAKYRLGIPGYVPLKRFFTRDSFKTKLFGGEREKKRKPATF